MWSVLWQRIAQTIRIDINSSEPLSGLQDIDDDQVAFQPSLVTHRAEPPDWSLLSIKGLTTALGIGTSIFAKVLHGFLKLSWGYEWWMFDPEFVREGGRDAVG